jgi:hypothetical protein
MMQEKSVPSDVTRARHMLERAIDDFERYETNSMGRRDAKRDLVRGIEALIEAKFHQRFHEVEVPDS